MTQPAKAAGAIPWNKHHGKTYFYFAQQTDPRTGRTCLSSFSGSRDATDKKTIDVAAREFREESIAIWGSHKDYVHLLSKAASKGMYLDNRTHTFRIYLPKVPGNPIALFKKQKAAWTRQGRFRGVFAETKAIVAIEATTLLRKIAQAGPVGEAVFQKIPLRLGTTSMLNQKARRALIKRTLPTSKSIGPRRRPPAHRTHKPRKHAIKGH